MLTHPGDSIRPGGGPIHHPPSAGGCPGSAHPGPRNPARETISCRPAATSPRSSLVSPALLPRPPKSPHIQRENGGEPRSDPGVRAPTRLGGGGGSPERTRLAAILGKCPHVCWGPRPAPLEPQDRSGVRPGWMGPDEANPIDLRGSGWDWHRPGRITSTGDVSRWRLRFAQRLPEERSLALARRGGLARWEARPGTMGTSSTERQLAARRPRRRSRITSSARGTADQHATARHSALA